MAYRDANIYLRGDQIDELDECADDPVVDGDSRSELARQAVDDLLTELNRDGGTA